MVGVASEDRHFCLSLPDLDMLSCAGDGVEPAIDTGERAAAAGEWRDVCAAAKRHSTRC